MIHHLLICTKAGGVIFSQFFDNVSDEEKIIWQNKLAQATKPEWDETNGELQRVCMIGDRFVVFTTVGEVLVFLTGSGEDDELPLTALMETISDLLKVICSKEKKPVSEAELIAQYDTLHLYVNETIYHGFIDEVDAPLIDALSRSAYDEVIKRNLKREKPRAEDLVLPNRRYQALPKKETKKK